MASCWLVLFLATAALVASCPPPRRALEPLDWWQTMALYQIYPRSFQDSNGDGTGDLVGITNRLDHLKDIGVNALWLSPVFKSPMVDFGYDISDFRVIDPLFGTMEDFDALLARAKLLEIKLILDFVPNHSSDDHDWFVKSLANDPDYRDYYVWRDPSGFDADSNPLPPNNWLSVFFGSAWTYREERGQFYLHQFDPRQPDLNYRNPKVVQEMKDIFTFWLDKGADGFRIDAIPHLFEDTGFPDEPRSDNTEAQPDDHAYLDHIYTTNQEETFDMVRQWRQLVDEYSAADGVTRLLMTEAYADIDTTMRYYGNSTDPLAHFSFNFLFIVDVNKNSSATEFVNVINLWMNKMPTDGTANWVVGNHDRSRVASRYGSDLADGMTMLIQLLPGVGVTYNGEEIGMVDTFISYNDTQDPQGCGAGPDRYQESSRDPNRTPFQWDNSVNSGFSTADKTWLPVNENYVTLNLALQTAASVSHYNVYKRLLEAKKTLTIQHGSLTTRPYGEKVVTYTRELEGEETFVVVVNLGEANEIINLNSGFFNLPHEMTVYTASIEAQIFQGDTVVTSSVPLRPKASLVLTGMPVNPLSTLRGH